MSFLGLDLGTSGLKALLTDAGGRIIGQAEHGYPVTHPQDGWAEQDPAAWIAALHRAVADLRAAHPAFTDLRGIAVSGQMHGATLLDGAGAVLRPCILWNDTRSHVQAAALDADPAFRRIGGNIVFPGFTAPKLLWLRAHEPGVFARVARVLLPAAYMNYYLTGDPAGDLSDASGSAWFDLAARQWSDDLLTRSGMRADQMPRLVEGCAPAGQLRRELAREWGLRQPVTVAGGAGDNAAAACGLGLMDAGVGSVSLGSSGVVMVAREGCAPAPDTGVHSFCHALPGRWVQMGVMLAAADNLNWLARLLSLSPQTLIAELGAEIRPPGPVRFLPYLAGERTPHNAPHLRAGFSGIGARTGRADMTRAVLEGVCFGLRDNLEALRACGAAPQALYATGGGARSEHWLALLATVLNLPILLPEGAGHGAALGAARLAEIAATGVAPASVITAPNAVRDVQPNTALVPAFDRAYRAFQAAARAAAETHHHAPVPTVTAQPCPT